MTTNIRGSIGLLGATGSVGRALAPRLAERGWSIRLLGRSRGTLRELASPLGAEWWTVAELSEFELGPALDGCSVVVNLAGPFSATTEVVTAAALTAGAHYLDISNEYAPVAAALARDSDARDRGITIMPAAGFGTVATEGLAAVLAERVEGPLRRANVALFPQSAARSSGAFASVIEVLGDGGAAVERGRLRRFPLGRRAVRMPGPDGLTTLIPAATGDLAAIPRTLGAEFVSSSVGLPIRPGVAGIALPAVSVLTRLAPLRHLLAALPIDTEPRPGPFVSYSWARVAGTTGAALEGWMRAGEGYAFTVDVLVAALERVLTGETPHGALTAIGAFGPQFLRGVAGVSIHSTLHDALAAEPGSAHPDGAEPGDTLPGNTAPGGSAPDDASA